MVVEKQAAAVKACFAFTKHAPRGDLCAASAASFNIFKKQSHRTAAGCIAAACLGGLTI